MVFSLLSTSRSIPPEEDLDASAKLWPDVSLLGVALIWGVNIPIMKNGLESLDVFVFNGVRLIVSALVLCGFAWVERKRGRFPDRRIRFRQVVVFAVLISAVYQLLFLIGVSRTASGNTALIIATVPMWTALLARVFLGERLRPAGWIGLCISLLGTIIVAVQKSEIESSRTALVGNLMVLAAALIWSGGTVYSRPLLRYISPLQLSAAAALIGLPVHLAFAATQFDESSVVALQSQELWAIILYSGILSSGLAQPMWSFGVRHAGAAHAAVVQNLVPVVAILAAWFSRGEPVTGPQIIGGAMILSGLTLIRITRWRS